MLHLPLLHLQSKLLLPLAATAMNRLQPLAARSKSPAVSHIHCTLHNEITLLAEDGRASLLDDIRSGNHMKRLKKAEKGSPKPSKKVEAKRGKEPPTMQGIFGDLLVALKRRREGLTTGKVKASKPEKDGDDEIKAPNNNAEDDKVWEDE